MGAGYFAPPRSPHRSRRSLDLALLLALQSDNSSAKKPACPSPPPTDPSSAHDPTVTVSMGLHTANHPAHTAGSEAGEVSGSSPPSGWFAGAGGVGSGSPLRGARKSSEDIRASPRKPLPLTFASGPAPAGVSTSTPPHGAIAGSAEAQMAHRGYAAWCDTHRGVCVCVCAWAGPARAFAEPNMAAVRSTTSLLLSGPSLPVPQVAARAEARHAEVHLIRVIRAIRVIRVMRYPRESTPSTPANRPRQSILMSSGSAGARGSA